MNEIFNFQVILTHFFGNIPFEGEMDRRGKGYTSSGESEIEISLVRYLFFVFLVT